MQSGGTLYRRYFTKTDQVQQPTSCENEFEQFLLHALGQK